MSITISLPKALLQKVHEQKIDLEKIVIEFLLRELKLNPDELVKIHIELAKKYLNEGKKLVEKDPVQASEKLYKAVEESIKALAIVENLEEILRRVKNRGRWTVTDLDKAARKLSKKIGKWVLHTLDHAWTLHVWGFHEGKLDSEAVKERIPEIEKMVKYVEKFE